jgi:hypothetical protein
MGELMATYSASAKDKERPGGNWKKIAHDLVNGKVPAHAGDRILDDAMTVQMFGMFGDLALAASYGSQKGYQRMLETVAGAPVTDAVKLTAAVMDSTQNYVQGKIGPRENKALYTQVIKHLEGIPFGIGAWLSQWAQEQVYPEMRKKQQIWRK